MNKSSLVQRMITAYHSVSFFGTLLQTIFIINSKHMSSQLQIRSDIHRKVLVVIGIVNSFFVRHV